MTEPLLPPPPDGARLAPLSRRAPWLSRPDIAYELPREGLLLFVEDVDTRVVVDADARELRAAHADGVASRPLDGRAESGLAPLWESLWQSPEPGDGTVHALLRWRGLFREVGEGPELDALRAWVSEHLAG